MHSSYRLYLKRLVEQCLSIGFDEFSCKGTLQVQRKYLRPLKHHMEVVGSRFHGKINTHIHEYPQVLIGELFVFTGLRDSHQHTDQFFSFRIEKDTRTKMTIPVVLVMVGSATTLNRLGPGIVILVLGFVSGNCFYGNTHRFRI